MVTLQRDIGAYIVAKNAFNPNTLNCNSTAENNVWQNGVSINRALTTPDTTVYLSGKICIPLSYSIAAARSALAKVQLQDSAAGSTWAVVTDKDGSTAASLTLGSSSSTAAQTGNVILTTDVNLAKCRQYVRVRVKVDFMGTTNSDDADTAGVLIMGGPTRTPAA